MYRGLSSVQALRCAVTVSFCDDRLADLLGNRHNLCIILSFAISHLMKYGHTIPMFAQVPGRQLCDDDRCRQPGCTNHFPTLVS